MAISTRDRILATSRRMFNEHGFGKVTTAMLAARAGIAEGNLWYHFKTKRDLLDAVSEEFLDQVSQRLAIRPSDSVDVIDEYARFLKAYMRELREYRFLYRDQADYGEHGKELLRRLPELYELNRQQLKGFFLAMTEDGVLEWEADRLDDLTLNATVIIRYFMEYLREANQQVGTGSGAVRQAFLQHLTLFEHRLQKDSATRLRQEIISAI